MTAPALPARRNPIARHLVVKQIHDATWLAAMFIVAVAIITAAVSLFTTIDTSAWEVATGIPRWFVGGWGVYITAVYLPLYITHGYTRRECARQAPAFVGALSLMLGLTMAVGYGMERLIYRALDWPQSISPSLLFDSPTQFPLVTLEYTLIYVVWLTAGMLLGAAFYRSNLIGFAVLPIAVGALTLIEAFTARPEIEITGILWWQLSSPPLTAAAGAYVIVVAVLAALTWRLARDLPVRTRNT